jgi:pimeloyl-ACP methyl ester carboxylesterase
VCEQLLAVLPPLPLHIAAHSMGNAVALLFSPATLARVRSFANLEGNLIAEDCGFSRMVADTPWTEYGARVFPAQQAELRGDAALRLDDTTAAAVHRSSQSLVRWSDSGELLTRFLRLPCRTAYFYGEENAAMPVLRRLERVERHCIPRSGHGMMLDNPEAFYSQLARFVRGPAGGAS